MKDCTHHLTRIEPARWKCRDCERTFVPAFPIQPTAPEREDAEHPDVPRLRSLLEEVTGRAYAGSGAFSWERHGDGWALYIGRDPGLHGLNVLSASNADAFDHKGEPLRALIAGLLNAAPDLLSEPLEPGHGIRRALDGRRAVGNHPLALAAQKALDDLRADGQAVGRAYLRLRVLLAAAGYQETFRTAPGGTDRFERTEDALRALILERDRLRLAVPKTPEEVVASQAKWPVNGTWWVWYEADKPPLLMTVYIDEQGYRCAVAPNWVAPARLDAWDTPPVRWKKAVVVPADCPDVVVRPAGGEG